MSRATELIDLSMEDDVEVIDVDEIIEVAEVAQEEKPEPSIKSDDEEDKDGGRRRLRRLQQLSNPLVKPSFIAIISPEYQGHLPKRIKLDINGYLGLSRKLSESRSDVAASQPAVSPPQLVSSFPVVPLPRDEGYYEGCVPLSLPDDEQYLNELQIMIRQQLEVFSATEDDVMTTQPGRRTPTVRGKVGIRCVHCAKAVLDSPTARRFWPSGSVSYPVNIEGLYSVCTQKPKLHFESCPYMPEDVKAQLHRLTYDAAGNSTARQNLNNISSFSIGATNYYLIAARRMGLVNVPGGIRFSRDLSLEPLSVESVRAQVEAESTKNHITSYGQLKAPSTESNEPRITADDESERVLAEAIAEKDNDKIIGRSDDSKLVTPFVFLCVRQMALCNAVPADFETRGKKTSLMRLGLAGFCCRHCNKVYNPETDPSNVDYSCRSFTSAADNLSAAVTNSFYLHLRNCRFVPAEIRRALAAYKRLHPRQMARYPHGSQRRLLHAVWARLRAADVSEEEMKERINNLPQSTALHPHPFAQAAHAAVDDSSGEAILPRVAVSNEGIFQNETSRVDSATFQPCSPACTDEETKALLKAAEGDADFAANDNLIQAGDRPLVTDFVFFMMRNLRVAIPTSADFARGRRTTVLNTDIAGFCCKHCHGQDLSASLNGRSFPSHPDNMSSSLNTSLYQHMLKCFYVPENIKRAVMNLKQIHSQQCSNLRFGSQRKFFNLVFSRLRAFEVPQLDRNSCPVKTEYDNAGFLSGDDILERYGFFRISPDLIECCHCRLVPVSLRAPYAVLTAPMKQENVSSHREQCKGSGLYLRRLSDALSRIMDSNISITYKELENDYFKKIVKELVGCSAVDVFTSGVTKLVRQMRGELAESLFEGGPSNGEVAFQGQPNFKLLSDLFRIWADPIDGVDKSLQSNKEFLRYFQLISPGVYLPERGDVE